MRGSIAQEMFNCIPEIDNNIGYRYFLGNMDNYTNALMSVLKSIKAKLPLLRSMNASGEYEGLRTITQTLRKMFDNVGAVSLAETSYQLETELLNDDFDGVKELLLAYISEITELSGHLELLMKEAQVTNTDKRNEAQKTFLNYDFTKTMESIKRSSDYLERRII